MRWKTPRSLFVFFAATLCPLGILAQEQSARVQSVLERTRELQSRIAVIPPSVRATVVQASRLGTIEKLAKQLQKHPGGVSVQPQPSSLNDVLPRDEADDLARVNNRASDLRFTRFGGYTDNTSSTARCGNQVVVGYNRSASILETFIAGTGGISFSGVSVSNDGGETFRDLGTMSPGPNATDFAFGEPSVTCSNPNRFYYAQMFSTTGFNLGDPTAIGLSTSTDGGYTWSDPVPAVSADSFHVFDSPWSAVDPSNPQRLFISYRDIDFSDTVCPALRTSIQVVVSDDGGQTFGAPAIIFDDCFAVDFQFVLNSRIAVSSKGQAFVAWEDATTPPLFVLGVAVASFVPGNAPTSPVIVDQMFQGGSEVFRSLDVSDEFLMQGGFQNYRGLDLAVDHSGGRGDGNVYVVWNDARNLSVPDTIDFFSGFYSFYDILFSRSLDGGVTFSPSSKINSDTQPSQGRGFDHFQPAIAVDRTGKVAACWKDRRDDPENYLYERFCATSNDAGTTWGNFLVRGTQSAPSRGQDRTIFADDMGNYDALTTDFLGREKGFIGAFQKDSSGMNPDVVSSKFK